MHISFPNYLFSLKIEKSIKIRWKASLQKNAPIRNKMPKNIQKPLQEYYDSWY